MRRAARVMLGTLTVMAPLICWAQKPVENVDNGAPIVRDVQFRSADITLSGTLVVPPNMVAAVVVVHGSGREARNVGLAQVLATNGVATLTYDKRGVGKSGGVYAGPEVGTNNVDPQNLDLLAGDASAGIKELVRRISSPRTPVGLMGVSQAGWIIPLAAVRTPEVKFMILWGGPLVTTLEQLRFQFFTEGKADFWDHHTDAEVRENIDSAGDRYHFVATDPVDALRKLAIPGLWLYGGRDVYVPVSLSIERLKALATSGKPFEYQLFPGWEHNPPFRQALSSSVVWLTTTVIQGQRDKLPRRSE